MTVRGHGAPVAARGSFATSLAGSLEPLLATAMFALTTIAIVAPLGTVLYASFRTGSPSTPGTDWTADNWLRVYGGANYLTAFLNTIALSAVVAVVSLILGGLLAWIIARSNAPGGGVLGLMITLPLMISNLITTLAWIALAAPNAGFINALGRELFGIPTLFNIYTFNGIVFVMAMHYAAFVFVAMFAALRSIDGALEEASYMLGAGPAETSVRMTLPLVWPTIAATFLMVFVMASENFSVPTMLGSPTGLQTLPSRIFFDMSVEPSKPTLAATGGTMLLWVALLGTLWQRRIIARASRYVTIGGKGSRVRVSELGRWRYLATGFVVLYVVLAVILPYLTLLFGSFLSFLTPRITWRLFTLANYAKLLDTESFDAVTNSLLISGAGGIAITAFYVLLSYLIKRSGGRLATLIDYLVIIPTAIPSLVLAMGMIWAFVRLPLPIYGTLWILIIAYLVRFIGFGVRHSRAALVQISDELPEAARVCGASPLRTFRDVVVPLTRPAILSLWTLMFIFIFTEISATILLYNPTTVTLPVALWNLMASGHQTHAFAIAVVQATIIFLILAVADRMFGTLRSTLEH